MHLYVVQFCPEHRVDSNVYRKPNKRRRFGKFCSVKKTLDKVLVEPYLCKEESGISEVY